MLGAVGGVLIADYFVHRHTKLDQAGLYLRNGPYWYSAGINWRAMIALAVGICLCVPGFLAEAGVFSIVGAENATGKFAIAPFWGEIYKFAWFASFGAAFVVYVALTRFWPPAKTA